MTTLEQAKTPTYAEALAAARETLDKAAGSLSPEHATALKGVADSYLALAHELSPLRS